MAAALLMDGRVVRANRAMCTLLGASRAWLEGRTIWELMIPEELERLRRRYEGRLRGEAVIGRYEMVLVGQDRRRVRVENLAHALDAERTLVMSRPVAVAPEPLAVALSDAATEVHRAYTPEAVIQSTRRSLWAQGLRAFLFHLRGDVLDTVEGGDDPLTVALATMDGHPMRSFAPSPGLFGEVTTRAQFVDDFPEALRSLIRAHGPVPDAVSRALARPEYARSVFVGVPVNSAVWGLLVVTSDRLSSADVGAFSLFAAQVGSALEMALAFQDLQRTNQTLAGVHAVAGAGAETALETMAPRLAAAAKESLSADRATLWVAGDAGYELAAKVGFGGDAEKQLPPHSLTGRVVSEGVARAICLTAVPPGVSLSAGVADMCHAAFFPLLHQGRRVGALNVARMADRPFSAAELQAGQLIADQVAIQIEKVRLIDAERRRVKELQLLLDVGRLITASLDLDEILDSAAVNVTKLVDAGDAWIWLYDSVSDELRGGAVSNPAFREHFRAVRLPLGQGNTAAGEAILRRRVVRVADSADSTIINATLNATYQVKSLVALPLLLRDRPIGAISVGDRHRERVWTDAEVERITVVASQVSVAVINARLFDDLKRSYDKLAQTREELVKRERLAALGELSAVVAHEVRNPLGVVFNALGSLRKAVRGNERAELLLGMVGEEADRLNRIVSDLLDFARPHEASLRLEPPEGVLESAREATLAITGGGVPIHLELAQQLPPVAIDARMLRQAFINLLVNAVQASPRGGAVRLRGAVDDCGVRIEVQDAGPGIPSNNQHRIFQPFFTTKATGTGLGLAVVKRIVEAHGGEVTLGSAEGQGTTFTVRLPRPSPISEPRV